MTFFGGGGSAGACATAGVAGAAGGRLFCGARVALSFPCCGPSPDLAGGTDFAILDRGVLVGFGASIGAVELVTSCSPSSTVRLLTTVFTPSIVAASLAADARSVSLVTFPVRVTTPFSACTPISRLVIRESPPILF